MSELGKDFWEMLAAKKWSERRDALAKLRTLASAPRLASADYGDINRYFDGCMSFMEAVMGKIQLYIMLCKQQLVGQM